MLDLPNSMEYDAIVVGGGIIGLWTAFHLVMQNQQVLVLEQFEFDHPRGSSNGASRLMKRSHKKPHCADLVPEAFTAWAKLEERSGKKLLFNTGHLSVVQSTTTGNLFDELISSMHRKQIAYSYLPGENISHDFPQLKFDSEFQAFFEPKANGAVLKANLCRQTLVEELKKAGTHLVDKTSVADIDVLGPHEVRIKTTQNVCYSSKSVVLACGTWINKLLKNIGLQLDLQACRVISYYWKEKQAGVHSRESGFSPLMVYCHKYHVYSIPADDYPGYLKVCYHARIPIDPDVTDSVSEESQQLERRRLEELRGVISRNFPALDHAAAPIHERCVQAVTPDSNFILSRHPLFENVIIGAGFSGHGFGASPAVGRILSQLVTTRALDDYVAKYFPLQAKLPAASRL